MKFEISIYTGVALLIISVFLSLIMIVYFLIKGRKSPILYSYILLQCLIFIWSFGKIFEVFSISKEMKWIFAVIQYSAVCFIGFSYLIFSLYYTNSKVVSKRKNIILLFMFPAIFYFTVLTNNYHHKFYIEFELRSQVYGILFWIHAVVSYLYIFSGTAILIKHSIKQHGNKKKQTRILILAMLFPFISNIIYISKIIKFSIDITSVSFSITLLLFAVATYRYRLLDISPIAIRKAVDNLQEAIIIIDDDNKVIEYNKAFIEIFIRYLDIESLDNISKLTEFINNRLINKNQNEEVLNSIINGTENKISGELILKLEEEICYIVNIQPILKSDNKMIISRKEVMGRIITFNNITTYKNLIKELEDKNEQLQEHMLVVEELTVVKERNRFARDVHDTLGHTLTLLITLLEATSIMCKTDSLKAQNKIYDAIKIAREGFSELRNSISDLKSDKIIENSIVYSLNNLIRNFETSNLEIELTVHGSEVNINKELCNVVYRVCQEALTNALRHGKATHVDIILKFNLDKIKIYIFDNGIGCKNIEKGCGLNNMKQRIKSVDGILTYGSDGEKGFNIHIEIPVGVD